MESWDGSYRDPVTRELYEQVEREEREPDSHDTARSVLDDYNTAVAWQKERAASADKRSHNVIDVVLECLVAGMYKTDLLILQDHNELARTMTALVNAKQVVIERDYANYEVIVRLTKAGEILTRLELRRYREGLETQRQQREETAEQVKAAVADSKRSKRILDLD